MLLSNFSKNNDYSKKQKLKQNDINLSPSDYYKIDLTNIKSNTTNNYDLNSSLDKQKSKYRIYNINALSNKKKNIKNYNSTKELSIDSYNDKKQNLENLYINSLSQKQNFIKSYNAYSLNKKIDCDSFDYNDDNSILKQKILKKLYFLKKQRNLKININKNQKVYHNNFKNNLSSRNLNYNNSKNPVVIKFQKDININNIYNNSSIYNNHNIISPNLTKNSEKTAIKKVIKPYIFTDINKKPELFRNLEDLEKKSIEIGKRKRMVKNFSSIKKDNNLAEIKLSLDAIRNDKRRINIRLKNPKGKNLLNNNFYKIEQKSIKNIYNTTENKLKNNNFIYMNDKNQNISMNNKKKLFFINNNNIKKAFNNKKRISQSPKISKKYIEDNIIDKVLTLSFNNTTRNANYFYCNKRNKLIKKVLPSISEEDDKIKSNIINLIKTLEKIINNKKIQIKRNSMNRIKKEKKIGKNKDYNYAMKKNHQNYKYIKKIIPKNINKNLRQNNKNNNSIGHKNNVDICRISNKLEKSINLIDKLRVNLIKYSLNNDYS